MLFCAALTLSCSNDDDNNNNNNDDLYMRYTVNGTDVEITDPETLTSLSTLIRGEEGMDDTYRAVSLWIPNDATVGSHPIEPNNGSQIDIYSAIYSTGSDIAADATVGTLNITDLDADYIEGTFSFTAEQDGTTYTVTDGEFRAYSPVTD